MPLLFLKNKGLIHCLLIAIIYLIGFNLYSLLIYFKQGYFPIPFFYVSSDTWMDFYHINWASLQSNIYSDIKLFYSPFNLVIAKSLVSKNCLGVISGFDLRKCDISSAFYFFSALYILNVYLLYKILEGVKNRCLWTTMLSLSFPVMYGLERGNYIQIATTFISLFILSKNSILKCLFISFAISIKFYLLVLLFPYIIFKKYRDFFIILGFLFFTFLLFGLLLGDVDWFLIPINIMKFSSTSNNLKEIFFNATNFNNYVDVARNLLIPNYVLYVLYLIKYYFFAYVLIRLIIFLIEVKIKFESDIDFNYFLYLTMVILLLISRSPTYYAISLLIPFFAYGLKNNFIRASQMLFFSIIILPYPLAINMKDVSNQINFDLIITAHSIVVPILLLLIFFELTKDSLITKPGIQNV